MRANIIQYLLFVKGENNFESKKKNKKKRTFTVGPKGNAG